LNKLNKLLILKINMKLKGKVAVVTGGARDLGRAISLKLASEGAKVVINYFDNKEDAEETLKLVQELGSEGIIVQGDMTKEVDVKSLFAETIKMFGSEIHVLANVVGGLVGRKSITEQDDAWYNFLMDVNMKSCWLCTREAVPHMPENSSIINFSSLAARDGGGPGASLYATAKGAVMTFTRSMAKELGQKGIRVNALAPGTIATSFHDRFNTPENRERMKAVYPLRREGDAGDIADLVLFLACADSDYLTGTNIDINGGLSFS
jgi:3-oxoacyl-[acyl-carrier protein] reductase